MGISNQHHFNWINAATEPLKAGILSSLPPNPLVFGLSEQQANPFIQNLFGERPYQYQAIDRYAKSEDVLPLDLNDLALLSNLDPADIACCFRASYFIEDKETFLESISKVLRPTAYLFIDFLTGTSDIPTLGFYYGGGRITANYDPENPSRFITSFFDNRILEDYSQEVAAFCKHARRWPLSTQWRYLRSFPQLFWRDRKRHARLYPENLKQEMHKAHPKVQLFSLDDFKRHGFEVLASNTHYFYPSVQKFNLYTLIAAQYRPQA